MKRAVFLSCSLLVSVICCSQNSRLQIGAYIEHSFISHHQNPELVSNELFDLVSEREVGGIGYGFSVEEEFSLSARIKLAAGIGVGSSAYQQKEEPFHDISGNKLGYMSESRRYDDALLSFRLTRTIASGVGLLFVAENKLNLRQKHVVLTEFLDGREQSFGVDESIGFDFRKYNLELGGGLEFRFFEQKSIPVKFQTSYSFDFFRLYADSRFNRRLSYLTIGCIVDINTFTEDGN